MDYLPIFVGVTAAAVVLQACILVALYVAVRKSSSRMEALATEVKTKVLPTADTAQAILVDLRPKIYKRKGFNECGSRADRAARCHGE